MEILLCAWVILKQRNIPQITNLQASLLKTLATLVRKFDNGSVLGNQKTLEIQNLRSTFGDIPSVITQKGRQACDSVAKDRNMAPGASSGA